MKRFVKEYANYRKANPPFLYENEKYWYYYRITCAVINYEKGFITTEEAMQIILTAHEFATEMQGVNENEL